MEAHYLTQDDLKIFFDDAKEEIISLVMANSSLLYKAKIEDCGIKFKDEIKEFQEMINFLNDREKQILIMYHSKALLSGIKVCQILEDHYKSHRYIFSDFKTLSIIKSSVDDPVVAFKRMDQNLLIIQHDLTKKEKMLTDFINVLSDHPEKKFILITTKGENNEQLSIDKKTMNTALEDQSNKLTDLTDESQKSLLEKESAVIFQGKEVTFSSLIDENTKHLISGEVLSMLINNEKIEIGKELEDRKYNEIKEYYIERKFSRTIKSQFVEKEASMFLIINDNEKPDLIPEDNRDILLISDNVDLFMKLCNEHINKNIHLLRKEGNEFVWQQSRGDLLHLRTFIVKDSQNVSLFEPESINDKEVIIAARPGTGKSMLLTRIALQNKKTDPSLLVLNIKLVDYSLELKRLQTDNNKAFVKFLYKTFLKKYTKLTETFLNSITITIEDHKISIKDNESKIDDVSWLEVQLFNEFYNNGKVIFFFDGFDEICPRYKEEVIELLKVLKRSRSKIWITTRPYNISEDLENELGMFSCCLEGFSQDEQQRYLKKFWGVDDERSGIFVKGLLEHFSKSTKGVESDFLGIPLHLNMLAVVFKKEFKKWYDSDAELFSISDDNKQRLNNLNYFYEQFIYLKFFDIRIKEKKPLLNTDDPDLEEMMNSAYKDILKDHRKLAAFSLLNESEFKLFLSKEKLNKMLKKIEDIKDGKEKTGIISHVSDNKPVFVHRTFAEYFLSHFIYDKLKTDSDADNKVWEFLIKQILVKHEYRVVRRFLNCLFADYMVDHNKSGIIKQLLKDIVVGVSYTPLYVASEEGLVEIVKFLLENQPDELDNLPDECFKNEFLPWRNWCSSHTGEPKFMERKFINVRCDSFNALEWAVQYQHEDMVRTLLENGACVTINSVLIASSCNYFSEQVFKVLLDYIKSNELMEAFICALSGFTFNFYSTEKNFTPLQMIIEKLDDINMQNEDGNTLLHIVAMFGNDIIFYLDLLGKGIDFEYQGRKASRIISKLLHTWKQVHSHLLEYDVKLKIINNGYAESNWVRTVELLLKKGANEFVLNNNGKQPIDLVPDFNETIKIFNSYKNINSFNKQKT